jgi:hypothetical protein
MLGEHRIRKNKVAIKILDTTKLYNLKIINKYNL